MIISASSFHFNISIFPLTGRSIDQQVSELHPTECTSATSQLLTLRCTSLLKLTPIHRNYFPQVVHFQLISVKNTSHITKPLHTSPPPKRFRFGNPISLFPAQPLGYCSK